MTSKLVAKIRARIPRQLRDRVRASVLAHEKPGRALTVYPDDTFIASYPKSGNTWTRFLVANLLHPHSPTTFGNIDVRVPTIYKATAKQLDALPRPRVLKSHEYFDPRYPCVICVVRDPRDVLVSYYHYSLRKGFVDEQTSIAAFADDFLGGRVDAFGTWYENVASWRAAREGSPAYLLVRYEDLQARCEHELARIANLLGVQATPAELARVAAECSFDKMRALERETGEQSAHLKHVRSEIGFVRRGKSGGWREEVPPAVAQRIEDAWGSQMQELGYLDTRQRTAETDATGRR